MKPNELRVGNWVSVYGSYYRLNEDGMEILFGARNYEDYTRVPLTPDILEKAMGIEIYIKSGQIIKRDDHYAFGFVDNEFGMEEETPIYYLHQLQNLYCALTGEDLDVNL